VLCCSLSHIGITPLCFFVLLRFWNLVQGVWGAKASPNIFSNLELGAKGLVYWSFDVTTLEEAWKQQASS
jgi:hypothetical protein